MQEYARIGVKKTWKPEQHTRYFINNQPDSKGDKSLCKFNENTPSNANNDEKEKPPELRIITEDTEDWPTNVNINNQRQKRHKSDKTYRNNYINNRGYDFNSHNNNQRSSRGSGGGYIHSWVERPRNQRPNNSQQMTQRSWLLDGAGSGGYSYRQRSQRSNRGNQYSQQRIGNLHHSRRWRGGRDGRARD